MRMNRVTGARSAQKRSVRQEPCRTYTVITRTRLELKYGMLIGRDKRDKKYKYL
jgi:hypothetical protein